MNAKRMWHYCERKDRIMGNVVSNNSTNNQGNTPHSHCSSFSLLFSDSPPFSCFLRAALDSKVAKLFIFAFLPSSVSASPPLMILSSPLLLDGTSDRTQRNKTSRVTGAFKCHPHGTHCVWECVCKTVLRRWIEGEGSSIVMPITAETHPLPFFDKREREEEKVLGSSKTLLSKDVTNLTHHTLTSTWSKGQDKKTQCVTEEVGSRVERVDIHYSDRQLVCHVTQSGDTS